MRAFLGQTKDGSLYLAPEKHFDDEVEVRVPVSMLVAFSAFEDRKYEAEEEEV